MFNINLNEVVGITRTEVAADPAGGYTRVLKFTDSNDNEVSITLRGASSDALQIIKV
jgi:hypothetical protein